MWLFEPVRNQKGFLRSKNQVPADRIGLWVAAIITVLGVALRFWRLSNLGLSHFDEGTYAISGLWAVTPFHSAVFYPRASFFSPPLYVILVGISYRLSGVASDTAAILVNVLVGGLTIALAGWIAREWLGTSAGVAAAALTAFSDYQIILSRTALTDVAFGCMFLLSLGCITKTFQTKRLGWAIASGIAVGAAWNTKYHGWLSLVIALLAILVGAVTGIRDRPLVKQLLRFWLVMCVIAVLCYLPWVIHVQGLPGGYAALMKYQRSFLRANWPLNLWRQAQQQWYMDGWLSRLSPALAFLFALFAGEKRTVQWKKLIALAIPLLASGFIIGGIGTIAVTAILGLRRIFRRGTIFDRILLASLAVWLLFTPIYRPYGRLALPLILCLSLAAVASFATFLPQGTGGPEMAGAWAVRPRWHPALAGCAGLATLLLIFVPFHPAPRTWMATDGTRLATTKMIDLLPKDGVVLVHGAPEVVFYLGRLGRRAVPIDFPIDDPRVAHNFEDRSRAYFLVTSIYSERQPRSRVSLGRMKDQLQLLGKFSMEPSDIRLLDDFTPEDAWQYREQPREDYDLRVYRIKAIPGEMKTGGNTHEQQ